MKSEPASVGGTKRRTARLLLAGMVLLPLMVTRAAQTQIYNILATFNGYSGAVPLGGLIADPVGNFYGTTFSGGVHGYGTVYELLSTGGLNTLYSFTGGTDGSGPAGSLVRDASGRLSGTTFTGGATRCGVVFVLNTSGKEKVLYNFKCGTDGGNPGPGLVLDRSGNLYGTTIYSGLSAGCAGLGCGVIFEISPAGEEIVLHTFEGPDGMYPNAALLRDTAGNLYGTTQYGGANGHGVVFKLDTSGAETVLYSFTGGADGGLPGYGALIEDKAGNLYGTTQEGGNNTLCAASYGCGVVFELDAAGNESVLYAFTGGTDGGRPEGGVIRDGQGNLYGTTTYNGDSSGFELGHGVVFKLGPTGVETVLHTFDGTDGSGPVTALLPYKGYLYGTTSAGGNLGDNFGVAFKLQP